VREQVHKPLEDVRCFVESAADLEDVAVDGVRADDYFACSISGITGFEIAARAG
jgi:hypothetical protein